MLPVAAATKTIFLVHSSSQAGSPVKAALQERGYQVIHAASIGEALTIWEKSAARIDLFLADISLGRDPGVEHFVQLLQAENTRMRVLYANDLEQTTGPLTLGLSYPKQLVAVVDNCLA